MAVLGSLGDLVLALSADTSKFQSDLGRADRIAKKFSREVGRALGTLAAGLLTLSGAAGFGGLIKSQIDAADEANKMSQKLGIATETLSEYFFAARLANVSNEQLQVGLQQLAKNQADFVIGTGEAKYAFDALGISQAQVKALNGDTAKLFELVASKLAGFADGGNKTALAMKLLGKSGAELIPLINSLESARKEAHELNAIIDKPTAMAAEQFNDNLSRMAVVVQAMGLSIAKLLLPGLKDATDRMVEGAKSGEPWLAFLKEELRLVLRLAEVIPGIAPIARAIGLAFNTGRQSVRGFQSEVRALDNLLQEKPDAPKLRDLAKEAKEAEERFKKLKAAINATHEDAANAAAADQEISKRQADDLRELAALREQFEGGMLGEEEQLATRLDQTAGAVREFQPALQQATFEAASFGFTFNSALEDAIVNSEDLSDVLKALEQDIARMLIRGSITEPLGVGIRGFLRDPMALIDPARFGAGAGADLSGLAGGFDIPAFAEGTDSVPRTGLALVHEGEQIIPAGKSAGVTIVQNISIDSRSDQASIMLAMRRAKDEAVAAVASMQSRRGTSRIG